MPLATTRQGSLHYEIVDQVASGREPRDAILFHHGIGASAGIWRGWFPALADAHRLVNFDMRGYGRSHIPSATANRSSTICSSDHLKSADGICERP